MERKAKAEWTGGLAGRGKLATESGAVEGASYALKTRFENEKGTNPEELIGAAHAGCFTMALAVELDRAGFAPERLTTEAAVTLEKQGEGWHIPRIQLTLRGKVPGVERDRFMAIAQAAKANCPVSKVLRAEISLIAELEG